MLGAFAGSSRRISLARCVLMFGGGAPLGNAIFSRSSVVFPVHNKLAVDHHCRHVRYPHAPGVYEVLLSQSQISLQALRIAALEALLHDRDGLLLIRWQSFRELGLKPF